MAAINETDLRLLNAMGGREKLKLLLSERGLTLKGFARKHSVWVQDVSFCIGGDRQSPEIRDALATELDLTREQIDFLIDGEKSAAARSA